jgi:O-antigen/teichoic acid export membrane protein
MSAANAESAPVNPAGQHASFFRQSGWLMFANVASGALMYAVHLFAKVIPEAEYAVFGVLLALTICVPTVPLQMVFAQQAAAALATGRTRQLTGMFRQAWLVVTALWVVAAAGMLLAQHELIARWGISNPAALWITLLVILTSAWLPMFLGLLQGKQDFLTFGWTMIVNGVGRVGAGVVIVVLLGGYTAGIMTGTLIGLALALGLSMWQSRSLWQGPADPFDRGKLLREVAPLLVGFGACQFLMAADTMIVKAYLPENAQCYVAAGTLSRAMVWAVGPLTAVMFPRIVASTVRSEKNNLFGLTLACTAAIAIASVVGLWLLGPWVVRFMAKPSYVEVTTQILPWYATAMVPLCVANVLASNLLGKAQFRVVIPMVVLALAYGVTLRFVHGSFVQVLQMLGLFNLALLAVCAWFTFCDRPANRQIIPTAA